MDDTAHLERFNHDFSKDLRVNAAGFAQKCSQELDFFLVLDLEGKVEILEFPVLIIDARTMGVVDLFHRFSLFPYYSCKRFMQFIICI